MKKRSIILTLAAILVAMVSCTKEERPVSGKFTMTVNANKGTRTTKDLSLSGTTLNATWKAGEEVTVYKGETLLGTLTASSDGSSTTLSGTIEGEIAKDDNLTLKFLSGNYSGQDGTLEYIAEHCDYAVATVTISGISDGSVKTTDAVFENKQAIVKFTLQNSVGSALPSNPTALTINYGDCSVSLTDIPTTTYTTNGAGVLYVALPGFSNKEVTLTANVDGQPYTKTVSGITFANGQYYTIAVGLEPDYVFSVSDTKTVHFSPGNLQYHWGTSRWRFAEHQWDWAGPYWNSSTEWVDLFGWGTWGSHWGTVPTPLASSTIASDYIWNDFEGTLDGHDDWYTLSIDEWVYLLIHSIYGLAKVNNVQGVIILPNGSSLNINTNHDAYDNNIIDASTWIGTYEAAGAVFLPAVGYNIPYQGWSMYSPCCYWSSTPSSGDYACCMIIPCDNMEGREYNRIPDQRYSQNSVRLVR